MQPVSAESVARSSTKSAADDPSPLVGADVIHGGFAFNDIMLDEQDTPDRVLANYREALRPGGTMAMADAMPYLRNERERRLSAAVTYYHRQFIERRLVSEDEWRDKLSSPLFTHLESIQLAFPTGRLLVAQR